jgi:hypothetical protein
MISVPAFGQVLGGAENQVDIDISDHCKRTHSFAPGDLGRAHGRSGIVDAGICKRDHEALRGRQHREDRREPGGRRKRSWSFRQPAPRLRRRTRRRARRFQRPKRHRGDQAAVASLAAEEHDTNLRSEHFHRAVPQAARLPAKSRAARKLGQPERKRFSDALQTAARCDDGRDVSKCQKAR